jgi:hypothetical protein
MPNYPGSGIIGQPPVTGRANRVPSPANPATAIPNYTLIATDSPTTAVANSTQPEPNTVETAQAIHGTNLVVPSIGTAIHVPLNTPLGLTPHFKTPTQNWTWDYGNGP